MNEVERHTITWRDPSAWTGILRSLWPRLLLATIVLSVGPYLVRWVIRVAGGDPGRAAALAVAVALVVRAVISAVSWCTAVSRGRVEVITRVGSRMVCRLSINRDDAYWDRLD